MKIVKIYLLSIVYILSLFVFAQASNLSDYRATYSDSSINIVPRSQRWADNNRLLRDNKLYDAIKKRLKIWQYAPKISITTWSTNTWMIKKTNSQIADEYLNANFSEEYRLDWYIKELSWSSLFRPIGIKNNKTKIIIHHTAWELTESTTTSVLSKLVDIYKYHTFTQWRWDIWYNFLIWPNWETYEWRAGGSSAVWAHASYNNTDSVWISLMWNYNLYAPTPEQYMSLTKLIISITKTYNINVYDQKTYHKSSAKSPYITDIITDSIVWHTHVGNTACPGKYIIEDLPYLKYIVNKWLNSNDIPNFTEYILSSNSQNIPLQISYLNRYNNTFSQWINNSESITCKSSNDKITVSCNISWGFMNMSIQNNWYDLSGGYEILINNAKWETYNLYLRLLGYSDTKAQYTKIQKIYITKYGTPPYVTPSAKIAYKMPISEIKSNLSSELGVMLYDLSTTYRKYNIYCKWLCNATYYSGGSMWQFKNISNLDITITNSNKINIYANEQIYAVDQLYISPRYSSGTIQFKNYKRNSAAKLPWNIFSWSIIIKNQNIRKLDGKWYNMQTVINKLPLRDYLAGIAESNDNEPYEKVKAMTILSKQYALYYMNRNNTHLYISTWSDFIITDDARISQKYVWAWFTSKKRFQAISETWNQAITYNNRLPILPYFSCSAGITRWADRLWRNDTPYLVAKLDPRWYCDDGKWNFAWHGVGLSGKWAKAMADKWYSYRQILEYYYDGAKITNL